MKICPVEAELFHAKVRTDSHDKGKSSLMFFWPCIIAYQYSETNVMHFLFNLLRIMGLYMFRALLAHPQEGLHKRQFI
jgi:hypothetical protein